MSSPSTERLKKGDEAGWAHFLKSNMPALTGTAARILSGDREGVSAEDIIQDGLYDLIRRMRDESQEPVNDPGAYLYGTVRRDAARARARMKVPTIDLNFFEATVSSEDDEWSPKESNRKTAQIPLSKEGASLKRLEDEENAAELRRAISTLLSPVLAVVINLRLDEGLNNDDIAIRLGIPAATVRTRMYKAQELLRDYYGAPSHEGRMRNSE